jgi:RNA polymerase sigma-70 factor (ECF subfamily)
MTTKELSPLKPLSPTEEDSAFKCPDFARIVRESTPDRSIFEQIAVCFSDRLEDFAKYVCRDETSGKDAFQDAMVSAMTYLDTYRGDSPIEPWLRKIVVSACSRLRRGKKNSPAVNKPIESTDDPDLTDNTPSQELRLMLAQRLDLVRREIEALEEPNRTLLELHDVQEIPIKEIVAKFQMSEDAVKSRLKRSRSQVRANLLEKL